MGRFSNILYDCFCPPPPNYVNLTPKNPKLILTPSTIVGSAMQVYDKCGDSSHKWSAFISGWLPIGGPTFFLHYPDGHYHYLEFSKYDFKVQTSFYTETEGWILCIPTYLFGSKHEHVRWLKFRGVGPKIWANFVVLIADVHGTMIWNFDHKKSLGSIQNIQFTLCFAAEF